MELISTLLLSQNNTSKIIWALILMSVGFILASVFIFLTINFRKNRVMKDFEKDRSKSQGWKDFVKLNVYPFLAIMGILILASGIYLEVYALVR